MDIQDLKYDTVEFIRKLSWKAFFKANPELQSDNYQSSKHQDIKVSGFKFPAFTHPLLDEVKTKLFGWIANHKPSTPKSNLTILEIQGKQWLTENIKEKKIFVSKADKGGATLVMNYHDVQTAIKNELSNEEKFIKLESNAEEELLHVRDEVRSLAIYLEQKKVITGNDKTLITGLTENNNPKLAPEYQPESPYAYPLFKVHKLKKRGIDQQKSSSQPPGPCVKVWPTIQNGEMGESLSHNNQ